MVSRKIEGSFVTSRSVESNRNDLAWPLGKILEDFSFCVYGAANGFGFTLLPAFAAYSPLAFSEFLDLRVFTVRVAGMH